MPADPLAEFRETLRNYPNAATSQPAQLMARLADVCAALEARADVLEAMPRASTDELTQAAKRAMEDATRVIRAAMTAAAPAEARKRLWQHRAAIVRDATVVACALVLVACVGWDALRVRPDAMSLASQCADRGHQYVPATGGLACRAWVVPPPMGDTINRR